MWGDPGLAARFSASVSALPAEIDAKGDLAVSVHRVGDRAADEAIAVAGAGAGDGAGVGAVVWLRSRVSAAGCVAALCNEALSGE